MPGTLVRSFARRSLAALAGAAALACSAAPAAQAAAGGSVISNSIPQSPAQVRSYWTPERMQSAEPVPLPEVDGVKIMARPGAATRSGGHPVQIHSTPGILNADFESGSETTFPQRVHGRVFFTLPEVGDFSCSGTVIASRLKNVVFTAGHCAYDPGSGQSATNWVFVPSYRDGAEPYGEFPATTLLAPEEWVAGDSSYDVAIAELSSPLEDLIGARGIAFNKAPRTAYKIYGYPGQPSPPYNGERLIECDAPFYGLELSSSHPFSTIAFPCNMTHGASGGGWVNAAGYVVSVSSHVYLDPALDDQIVGPYFADGVKKLYNAAGGSAECPPAKQAVSDARKLVKKARKAVQRRAVRKARKRLRTVQKGLHKAQSKRDTVC
jgi:hypothetical protein